MRPNRKPIRLPVDRYSDQGQAFSITITVKNRRPVFRSQAFGLRCVDYLAALGRITKSPIFAYCIMPDHVHLLIAPGPTCSVVQFVRRWKSLCTRDWHLSETDGLWQRGFYDHALRHEEGLRRVAEYILENPVRGGLVKEPAAYPLSGSLEWDL